MQKRDQVDDDERRRLRSVVSRTAHSACSCRGYRAPRTLIEYVSLTRDCGAVSGVRGCHCVSKLSRSSQRDSMRINVTDSRSAPAFATLLAFAFFDNCRRGEETRLSFRIVSSSIVARDLGGWLTEVYFTSSYAILHRD